MSDMMFDTNDPRVREHYSARMFEDSVAACYFGSNLMGRGERSQAPVQLLIEPLSEKEDRISFYLDIPLRGSPVYGDDKLEGHFEFLDKHKDTIYIGQVRRVYSDDRMTSSQQVQNLRKKARKSLVDGYGRLYDQLSMLALSGRPGAVNEDRLDPDVRRVCKDNKVFTEPDSDPIFYGGDATSLATLDESDTLTLAKIEELRTYAVVMGNDRGGEGIVPLRPLRVNGMKYYVLLMHPYSAEDLRKSTNKDRWQSIEEAARKAAEAVGSKSPIFKKAFGLIGKQVLLHQHELVPRFNDGGAAKNVEWSRTFLLGHQALTWAFGGAQPGWFDWREEIRDYGNRTVIAAYTLLGIKRTTFKGKAFGMIAVDHALSKKPADS